MKTTINHYAIIFFTLLFVSHASFSQQEEKEDQSILFSTLNHKSKIDSGIWFATIEKETMCLQLMDSRNRNNPSFMISLCIPREEFTVNTSNGFELNKASGTIKFTGAFPNDSGNGDFNFVKNRDFAAFLQKEGIDSNDDDSNNYFKLFLGDISREYVIGLKKYGYQPTLKQLGKLGIHDVSLDYINSIASTGYKGLELEMLVKFAIHDITADYIKDLEKAGYGDMNPNMVKKFAIHEVSIDYIKGLSELGYSNLDPNMVKNFVVHNITIDYIQGLSEVGFANLDPGMLKNFAVHNVSPKYIKSIRDTGVNNPDAASFKKAKVHGLTADYIKRAMANGHNSNELTAYIKLKIHGK